MIIHFHRFFCGCIYIYYLGRRRLSDHETGLSGWKCSFFPISNVYIYYWYIYLFICWKSKIIVKNAYIVFYWAQKQSFAPKYSQRTECVDNSVRSLRGSIYYTVLYIYSVHEGTGPKIHSFSDWHSVVKEFQKELDGSSRQVICFFFFFLFG